MLHYFKFRQDLFGPVAGEGRVRQARAGQGLAGGVPADPGGQWVRV